MMLDDGQFDQPDYTVGTFFGDLKPDGSERVGVCVAAAEAEYGKGKVFAWSDSTLFSNFAVFMPNKFELSNRIVNWLGGGSTASIGVPLLYAAAGVWLLIFVFWPRASAAGALSAVAVLLAAGNWQRGVSSNLPELRRDLAFLEVGDTRFLPWFEPKEGGGPDHYVNAYVSSQRTGRMPVATTRLDEALRTNQIVIVGGAWPFNGEDSDRLYRWVERGGHLVLLDMAKSMDPGASAFVQRCGMRVSSQYRYEVEREVKVAKGPYPDLSRPWQGQTCGSDLTIYRLDGGKALLTGLDGQSLSAQAEVGSGKITASVTLSLFSDYQLGEENEVPNGKQAFLLNLLYEIWQDRSDSSRMARREGTASPGPARAVPGD
jgi:hypothetical protein